MKAAGEAKADGQITPAETKAAIDAGKVLVIDVRDTRDEWVEGSVQASLGTLAFKADASMADFKDPAIADYPKSDPVIVTCALGGQAAIGAGILKDFGFENVKIMDGGMKAWKEAGLVCSTEYDWGSFSLAGKSAIVTGAASGIGKAIATLYAKKGADTYVLDLSEESAVAAAAEIAAETGGKVTGFACNVAKEDEVNAAFAKVLAKCNNKLDILVNNAGIAHVGTVLTTEGADMDRLYNVNVRGVFHCIQAGVKAMIPNKGGNIINLASIGSIFGIKERFAYGMTKGAVLTMTYATATDHVKDGIRSNCIAPARVHTPFVEGFLSRSFPGDPEGKAAKFKELSVYQPMARMGQPREVAAMALYLAADESAFCTGQCYSVDGGVEKCFDAVRPEV